MLGKPPHFLFCGYSMAENIYSKGTRVWFEDKDHAWISAEVVSVTKGNDDNIKVVFVDERGKVRFFSWFRPYVLISAQEITINTSSKEIKESKEGLPPLRNPPLLETADDLATLSHLNEPSGLLSFCIAFLPFNIRFCSLTHYSKSLWPAQHIYIQRHRSNCRQPFPTRQFIWSRNYTGI